MRGRLLVRCRGRPPDDDPTPDPPRQFELLRDLARLWNLVLDGDCYPDVEATWNMMRVRRMSWTEARELAAMAAEAAKAAAAAEVVAPPHLLNLAQVLAEEVVEEAAEAQAAAEEVAEAAAEAGGR